MIKGLDQFKAHFERYPDSYLMIGGVACHEWFQTQGLEFRATKDIDVVIVVEALTQSFVDHFWSFIEAGAYEVREKSEGERILYRFSKPKDGAFPFMIEVFSRRPETITLWDEQTVVPIVIGQDEASLSAILLDDAYYRLVLEHPLDGSDPSSVSPIALIPLKAKAWLDLSQRKANGDEKVDSRDIDKHRTDVFRLAATLSNFEDSGNRAAWLGRGDSSEWGENPGIRFEVPGRGRGVPIPWRPQLTDSHAVGPRGVSPRLPHRRG